MSVGSQIVDILRRHGSAACDELEELFKAPSSLALADDPLPEVADFLQSADGLPSDWRLVETREGESYRWPEGREEYATFRVFEGRTQDDNTVQYAIGQVASLDVWGMERTYFVVFHLGAGRGSKQPIVVFLAADDYEQSHECVAIIRGKGGGRGQQMFAPGDDLPAAYDGMRIEVFRDRIQGTSRRRGYDKLAVIARDDDIDTMLRHASIQVQMRHS